MTERYLWPDEQMRDELGRPLFCVGPDCDKRNVHAGNTRGKKYCSVPCRERASALREGPCPSSSPGWEAIKAETPKGLCAVCETPLPPPKATGRRRIICGSRECTKAYDLIWRTDRVARMREGRLERGSR